MADEATPSDETSWYDQAVDTVEQAYDSAAETVQQAYDSTAETAQQAYDSTVETVQEAYDWTADTAQQAYDSTVETVQQVWSDVGGDGQLFTNDVSVHTGPNKLPWPSQGGPPTHYVLREGQMTDDGPITVEWLRAQGYQRTSGDMWVHPVTGDSVHLFPAKDSQADEEQPEPDDPPDAGATAEEARGWADYLAQQAAAIPAELDRCEELIGQSDYAECYNNLVATWNALDNDLNTARGSADGWRAAASDQELVDLEYQIDRMEQTREWRDGYSGEFWPRMGQLPQP